MAYTIRRLTPGDVELARELFHFFQADDGEAPTNTSYEYMTQLLSRDDFHVIVALQEERVIGGLTAYELEMYKEPIREMFLYEIGVEPVFRRTGVARELIEFLKAICTRKGITEMYVGALAHNTPAVRLYAGTGGKVEEVAWFTYKLDPGKEN